MAKLTPKQEAFCQEYLLDLNATQAAIRAGYSERVAAQQGAENLRKPYIDARLKELLAERAERLELTADWVLERLRETAERCLQHEPVRDRKGEPTGEYRFDSAGACRALELLGKHLGMFKDQLDVKVSLRQEALEAEKKLAELPPAEILRRYRELELEE